ncbi:HAD-like protein [Clavulina sp. PMI_390]|nr:HAD-like protein [Clavulina sp. PMI_390]
MSRIVLFDAFATLIKPRRPISEQYGEIFTPHFAFDGNLVKSSFKSALKQNQASKPAYGHSLGAEGWWSDVIRATAIGAGGDPNAVEKALPSIVPALMKRFSSGEGYELYPDVLTSLKELRARGDTLGVVSNSDSRVRAVLEDLKILPLLDVCLVSEEEGVEKPNQEIWRRALEQIQLEGQPGAWYVGDELDVDYHGAVNAGLSSLLIRRPGLLGDDERKEVDEDLGGVRIIHGLDELAVITS